MRRTLHPEVRTDSCTYGIIPQNSQDHKFLQVVVWVVERTALFMALRVIKTPFFRVVIMVLFVNGVDYYE